MRVRDIESGLRGHLPMKVFASPVYASCLLLLAITGACEAVRCLQCQDGADPRTCMNVATCAQDETCYVEEVVTSSGHIAFHSGCMKQTQCHALGSIPLGKRSSGKRSVDSVTTCLECCSGDICNKEGCGRTVSPVTQQGPYCFTCVNSTNSQPCGQIAQCPDGEICGLYTPMAYLGAADVIFQSTCMAKAMCSALHGAYFNTRCVPTCCDTDFCNVGCNSSYTHLVTQPPQTEAPTTTITIAPGLVNSCPSDHLLDPVTGMCIVVFLNKSVTWNQANTACHGIGDRLATVDNAQKMDFVENAIKASQTMPPHFTWIGGYYNIHDHKFSWTNGPSFTYTNWGGADSKFPNQQPDGALGTPNCVGVFAEDFYKWHDEPCDHVWDSYVCEHVTDGSVATATPPAVTCSATDGYKDYGHGLCLRLHADKVTWQQARDRCHAEHTELVVLDTREKSDALLKFADTHEQNHNFWIGGHDKYQNNTFYWVTGWSFTYADWFVDPAGHQNQPNNVYNHRPEDCVAIFPYHSHDHHWHDTECGDKREYFCQRI